MLLKLEKIGKIYDSNDILTVGIRGIDLAFDYNEFVTIEGESGSGKSTLLNVIGANDTYEEGELYFNGEPTSHYSESDWEKYREKNIATIFQDFNIIENLTVLENVELALLRLDDKKERRRRAKELIARVGLTEQMNRRGSKLSGGEKQRTVIARALAKDAPIILADEPTGNLDVKASKEVAALLKEVSRDKLVIVVTHNPEFFKQYATRRVRIFDGSVSEDKQIEPPAPYSGSEQTEQITVSRFHNFKNTLHIGVLNYKSRPKFTTMMSLALAVCAVTLFLVIALFGQSLISPLTTTLDGVGIEGKVIVSGTGTAFLRIRWTNSPMIQMRAISSVTERCPNLPSPFPKAGICWAIMRSSACILHMSIIFLQTRACCCFRNQQAATERRLPPRLQMQASGWRI